MRIDEHDAERMKEMLNLLKAIIRNTMIMMTIDSNAYNQNSKRAHKL